LHAIWLFIPTDNDRPFGFLQSGFLSESTASVPIVGIFTKLDGRRTKVEMEVLGPAATPSDFINRADEVDQKVTEFVNGLETRFRRERYPPADFIRVGDMGEASNQSGILCDRLLRVTMDALPQETQRSLLGLTVRKRNRRIHTISVLKRVLDGVIEGNIVPIAQDEESELWANKGFRILMELYGLEDLYEYKTPQAHNLENENEEQHQLETVYVSPDPY